MGSYKTDKERITKNITINKNTNCWEWNKMINRSGYGCLFININIDKPKKLTLAHRFSYKVFNGDFPIKDKVLHKCDNRKCVNPNHLFLGTQNDNMKDMKNKGRSYHPIGTKNPKSKLDEQKVSYIKRMLKEGVKPLTLSEMFGVSRATISDIKLNKHWTNVE